MRSRNKGAGDDDDGEPKSQAYYVIKAAQEREGLQREVRPWFVQPGNAPHAAYGIVLHCHVICILPADLCSMEI